MVWEQGANICRMEAFISNDGYLLGMCPAVSGRQNETNFQSSRSLPSSEGQAIIKSCKIRMQDSGVEGNLSWVWKDKQVLGKENISYFKLKETLGWRRDSWRGANSEMGKDEEPEMF